MPKASMRTPAAIPPNSRILRVFILLLPPLCGGAGRGLRKA
jgi:hypothetical protein